MATSLTLQHPTYGNSATRLGTRGNMEPRRVRLKGSGKKDQLDDTSLTPSSDDPLRILAPGQKKLSTIESQRVLAVMEEAIRRMRNAMLIPVFASALERYSVSLGAELVDLLNDYSHLSVEYNRLYGELEQQGSAPDLDGEDVLSTEGGQGMPSPGGASTSSLMSSGHPTRLEPLQQEQGVEATEARFQQVRLRLKHCVKCILRALHRNASTSSVIPPAAFSAGRNVAILQEEMRYLLVLRVWLYTHRG